MKLIAKLIVTALALLAADAVLPGITVTGFWIALVVAIILGLLNLVIKPILTLLTLPITIVTFGLFTFIINAFLFWLASTFIEGFAVSGFLAALIGSLFVSALQMIGSHIIETID